jgi:hypothetical protein
MDRTRGRAADDVFYGLTRNARHTPAGKKRPVVTPPEGKRAITLAGVKGKLFIHSVERFDGHFDQLDDPKRK